MSTDTPDFVTRKLVTKALAVVLDALEDAVKTSGRNGAPGGVLYAAVMTYGFDLQQFQTMMDALVRAKRLIRRGQLYFTPENAG